MFIFDQNRKLSIAYFGFDGWEKRQLLKMMIRFRLQQAENYLSQYLGATNFIWLEGLTDEDIADAHIDGMARFVENRTILN